jgi:hypothetical protein
MRAEGVPGGRFETLVPIISADIPAADDVGARLRQQLQQEGLTILRRSGMWETEGAALVAICPLGQPSDVDGVLFVWWNKLQLSDCATHRPAFHIAGGYRGVEYMVGRLVLYIRGADAQPK